MPQTPSSAPGQYPSLYKWILDGKSDNSLAESVDRHTTRNGLKVWYGSQKGLRKTNEDRVGILEVDIEHNSEKVELVVVDADGMGGVSSGDICADCVVTGVLDHPLSLREGLEDARRKMEAKGMTTDPKKKQYPGACFVAARFFQDDKGNWFYSRVHGGDCGNEKILPNGTVEDPTIDKDMITFCGLDEEDAIYSIYRGVVIDPITMVTDVQDYDIDGPIPCPPGCLVCFGSDGIRKCFTAEETAAILKQHNFDYDAAIQELSDKSVRRMNNREKYRDEIEDGEWQRNGQKCSDGYTQMPPHDNLSFIWVLIPPKKKNTKVIQKKATAIHLASKAVINVSRRSST